MNDVLWTLAAIVAVAAVHVARATVFAARDLRRSSTQEVRVRSLQLPESRSEESPAAGAQISSTNATVMLIDPTGRCAYHDGPLGHLVERRAGVLSLEAILGGDVAGAQCLLNALRRDGKFEPRTIQVGGTEPVALSGIALRDRHDGYWGAALFLEPLNAASTHRD